MTLRASVLDLAPDAPEAIEALSIEPRAIAGGPRPARGHPPFRRPTLEWRTFLVPGSRKHRMLAALGAHDALSYDALEQAAASPDRSRKENARRTHQALSECLNEGWVAARDGAVRIRPPGLKVLAQADALHEVVS